MTLTNDQCTLHSSHPNQTDARPSTDQINKLHFPLNDPKSVGSAVWLVQHDVHVWWCRGACSINISNEKMLNIRHAVRCFDMRRFVMRRFVTRIVLQRFVMRRLVKCFATWRLCVRFVVPFVIQCFAFRRNDTFRYVSPYDFSFCDVSLFYDIQTCKKEIKDSSFIIYEEFCWSEQGG